MFGSLMGPTAEAQPADLESKWNATLKDPKVQAMLLAAGQQLMMPRWTAGSALPDAMGAAGRTASGIEEQEYARRVAEQQRQDKLNMNEADNKAALERTRIAADNRAEVANIRGEYGMAIQNSKDAARRELVSAKKTPDEEKFWQSIYKSTLDDIIGNRGTPAEREARAQEAATNALVARRTRFGPSGSGQGPIAGEIPSANPAGGQGQQGLPGAGTPGKFTSKNMAPSGEVKISTTEALKKLKDTGALDRLLAAPDAFERLSPLVSDPEYLRKYLDLMRKGR